MLPKLKWTIKTLHLFTAFILTLVSFYRPPPVFAQATFCSQIAYTIVSQPNYGEAGTVVIQVTQAPNLGTEVYYVDIDPGDTPTSEYKLGSQLQGAVFHIQVSAGSTTRNSTILLKQNTTPDTVRCTLGQVQYSPSTISCTITTDKTKYTPGENISATISYTPGGTHTAHICMPPRGCVDAPSFATQNTNTVTFYNTGGLQWQTYAISAEPASNETSQFSCFANIVICPDTTAPECQDPTQINSLAPLPYNVCSGVKAADKTTCQGCLDKQGIWTGLGCIRFHTNELITDLMRILFGLAGGIALVLMLFGALTYTTAGGDPKKADQAKEIFTSAVTGLLLIIFSIIILQFVGVTILALPGF